MYATFDARNPLILGFSRSQNVNFRSQRDNPSIYEITQDFNIPEAIFGLPGFYYCHLLTTNHHFSF